MTRSPTRSLPSSSSQDRADAGDHLLEAEGLGDVVVAADRQALDLVAHVVARGEEQDRRGQPGVPEPSRHGEAVHVGQHDVEDDEVGAHGLCLVERGGAVLGGGDVETGEAEG